MRASVRVRAPERDQRRGADHRSSRDHVARMPADDALVGRIGDQPAPVRAVEPEEGHEDRRGDLRRSVREHRSAQPSVTEALRREVRGKRQEGDAHEQPDIGEEERAVNAVDDGHVGVMVDPYRAAIELTEKVSERRFL